MKKNYILIILTLLMSAVAVIMNGCKYDVAEPQWETTTLKNPSSSPSITSITPAEAVPGVNTITINGSHLDKLDSSKIFLDDVGRSVMQPEVISISANSIVIRRPNLATDNCMIKLNPDSGSVFKFGPYKISPVVREYGSFQDNNTLGCLAVDKNENVFGELTLPAQPDGRTPFTIYKLTPDGNRTVLDTLPIASGLPPTPVYDMKVGPDGFLYLFRDHKVIQRVDPNTGRVSSYYTIAKAKKASYGDFDAEGYLYAGGNKSDLQIISRDSTAKTAGVYASDSIFAVTVANNYVYVVSKNTTKYAVYRHKINGGGNISTRETVLDLQTPEYQDKRVRSLSVAADGTLYIGILAADAMLVVPPSGQIDVFYKGIIPGYIDQAAYGNSNFIYVISGNAAPAQPWKVFRIDTGNKNADK